MREIKFRAWDTRLKKMYEVTGIDLTTDAWYDGIRHHHSHNGRIVPMQFTGLQDKNGKGIYEGDIVNDPLYVDRKYTVVWDKCLFRFKEIPNECWLAGIYALVEVIGNIYENPELLAKQ